jgi:hypothetical protein
VRVVGRTVAEACNRAIESVYSNGEEARRDVGSWVYGVRERKTVICHEVHGMVIEIENPVMRWHSRVNAPMMVESLDYLLGLNPGYVSEMWKFYNIWRNVDGRFPYTYGERISECIGQVVQKLKENPTTRHAVLPIYRPQDILVEYQPCNVDIAFLPVNDRLDCLVHCRSQDALRGLFLDTFAYSLLHEVVANEVGMKIGKYIAMENNIHIYGHDLDKIDRLKAVDFSDNGNVLVMSKPFSVERDMIRRLLDMIMDNEEEKFKGAGGSGALSPFWREYLYVIASEKFTDYSLLGEMNSVAKKVIEWKLK